MKRLLTFLLTLGMCFTCSMSANAAAPDDNPECTDNANSWRYENGKLIESGLEEDMVWGVAYHQDATLTGIDVSVHQGVIDWEKVMNDGVDFAIIRCGYGRDQLSQDDTYFERNAMECERLGIPYGVYLYSYAQSTADASSEADHVLRLLKGRTLSYPVFYDMEDNRQAPLGNAALANLAKTFCNKISAAGYPVGVYANLNWWNNYLTDPCFDNWHRWVAQYNTSCQYKGDYTMWQYTSSGSVKGISGRVDMNFQIGYPKDHGVSIANSLATNKDVYEKGEAILTTAAANVIGAWVAIYDADDAINPSLPSYYWYYVNGKDDGSGKSWIRGNTYNLYDTVCNGRMANGYAVTAELPSGDYRVALLYGDDYKVLTEKTITITEPSTSTASLTVDKESFHPDDPILVKAVNYNPGAWVGIYPGKVTDNFDNSYIYSYKTNCNNNVYVDIKTRTPHAGSAYLDLPLGTYTLALFNNSGHTNVAQTITIAIENPKIRTDKDTYSFGEPIMVTTDYKGASAHVGLFKKGEAQAKDNAIFLYKINDHVNPVDITKTGNVNNRQHEFLAGEYTLTLFLGKGTNPLESVDITITKEVVSESTVIAASCTATGSAKVTYSDGTYAIVILPVLGHQYGDWKYDAETKTHSRTCLNDASHKQSEACRFDDGKTITAGVVTYTCETCTGTYDEVYTKSVSRIYGSNRYETSLKIADALKVQLGIEKFDTVILANGKNFADALAGSYLASVKQAPILIVTDMYAQLIEDYVKANLSEDGTVYLLGGENAVSGSFATALRQFKIRRLAGANRYETNLAILKESGVTKQDILVCTGTGFADSLSASATRRPILLVGKELSDAQRAYLATLPGNNYYIIGGVNAVSASVENELKSAGHPVIRFGGATRYETSILIAKTFFPNPKSMVLAYGPNFPDGLCGGSLAAFTGASGSPLVLSKTGVTQAASDYASNYNIHQAYVLGGPGLISDEAVDSIIK